MQNQRQARSSIQNPNQRNKADKCEICGKAFSLLAKQHECKRCIRAVCYYCAKDKEIVPAYDSENKHRICTYCKDEQVQLKDLKDKNVISFARNSFIGKKWLKFVLKEQDNFNDAEVVEEYNQIHARLTSQPNEKVKTIVQQSLLHTYNEVKHDMNYSTFEWHYILTSRDKDSLVVQKITSVLTAFYETYPIKLTKNLVQIILFLLYFCDEIYAYKILSILHKELIPTQFQYHKLVDEKQVVDTEVNFIQEIMKKNHLLEGTDLIFSKKFLEFYSTTFLSNLFINKLNFLCSYFLFDYVLKNKEFYEFERTLAQLFYMHQKNIKTNGLKVEALQEYIVKNTQLQQLRNSFAKEDRMRTHRSSILQQENHATEINIKEIVSETALEKEIKGSKEFEILQQLQEVLSNPDHEPVLADDVRLENKQMFYAILAKLQALQTGNSKQKQQIDRLQNDLETKTDESLKDSFLSQTNDLVPSKLLEDKETKINNLQVEIEGLKTQIFELNNRIVQQEQQQRIRVQSQFQQVSNPQQDTTDKLMQQMKNETQVLLQKHQENQLKIKHLQSELALAKKDSYELNTQIIELKGLTQKFNQLQNDLRNALTQKEQECQLLMEQLQTQVQPIDHQISQAVPELSNVEKMIKQLKDINRQKERELYDLKFCLISANQQLLESRAENSKLLKEKTENEKSQNIQNRNSQDSAATIELKQYYEAKIEAMNRELQQHQDTFTNERKSQESNDSQTHLQRDQLQQSAKNSKQIEQNDKSKNQKEDECQIF